MTVGAEPNSSHANSPSATSPTRRSDAGAVGRGGSLTDRSVRRPHPVRASRRAMLTAMEIGVLGATGPAGRGPPPPPADPAFHPTTRPPAPPPANPIAPTPAHPL